MHCRFLKTARLVWEECLKFVVQHARERLSPSLRMDPSTVNHARLRRKETYLSSEVISSICQARGTHANTWQVEDDLRLSTASHLHPIFGKGDAAATKDSILDNGQGTHSGAEEDAPTEDCIMDFEELSKALEEHARHCEREEARHRHERSQASENGDDEAMHAIYNCCKHWDDIGIQVLHSALAYPLSHFQRLMKIHHQRFSASCANVGSTLFAWGSAERKTFQRGTCVTCV